MRVVYQYFLIRILSWGAFIDVRVVDKLFCFAVRQKATYGKSWVCRGRFLGAMARIVIVSVDGAHRAVFFAPFHTFLHDYLRLLKVVFRIVDHLCLFARIVVADVIFWWV